MFRVMIAGLAAACVLVGPGCKSCCKDEGKGTAAEASVKPVNTICPIGEHAAKGGPVATWKGKTIQFCCEDCVEEFQKSSPEKKDELLAKAIALKG